MKKMKKTMWLILLLMAVFSTKAQVAKTGYCTPAPTSVDGIGITNVTFSSVNNTTTDETGNYGDYSTMIGDVQQTAIVPVAITYETGYDYDTKIWIDWNDDLDFDDAGEEVYTGTSLSDNPTTLNASFEVPLTATLGHHRMRIGGQDSGPCDPCYSGSYGTFEDYTINVTTAPTCIAPTAVNSLNITSTSADIAWTGDLANYNVDYRIIGEATWTSTTTTSNSISLASLTSGSTYEVRVQKDCGFGDLSAWSIVLNFNTLCASSAIPYFESFESITAADQLPNCMQATNLGNMVNTYLGSDTYNRSARTGSNYLSFMYGADDWAFTPAFDLTAGTSYDFTFWYKSDGLSFDTLQVFTGNAQTAIAMTTQVGTNVLDITNTTYQKFTGTIVPSADGTFIFGIRVATSSVPYYLTIDDIALAVTPTCVEPTAFTASNNTSSTIDLTWSGTAPNYRVQYRETGAASWTYTDLIATTTTTISGLNTAQSYDFQVRAICSASDSSTLTSVLTSFTTQVPATVPYSIDFESGATNWSIVNGTEPNHWVSGTATANGGTQAIYITNDGATNDYDNSASSVAHIYRDITFTPSTIGYTLKFDWKGDGEGAVLDADDWDNLKVFLVDATTLPVAGTELSSGLVGNDWYNLQTSWKTDSILLPASLSGTTKRLVFSWVNDDIDGATPPAAIDNVSIAETVLAPCETPSALTATNITETTADLNWTSTAGDFNVRYRIVGAATWTATTSTATTLSITGLTSDTQYEFQIQAACSAIASDTSDWAAAVNFTTLVTLSCATPSALGTSNIGETTADLNWTSTAPNFNVRYRIVGAATWTNTTAAAISLALTGLTASTQYQFQVQAICSATAGDTSYWANAVSFTTLAIQTCPNPTSLVVSAVNTADASLNWTPGGTETAWNIRYKKSSDATYTNVNNTTTKPYILSALQASTAYVWSVQAVCSGTLNSGWVADNAFTTTVGIEDNALNNLSVYSYNNQVNVINNGNILVKEVVIYDVVGQQVGAYVINSNENILINTRLTVGNYVIKVVTEKQVITKKLLIN
jgi:hypothetical protein